MARRLIFRAVAIFLGGGILLSILFGVLYINRDQTVVREDEIFAEPGAVPIGGPFSLIDHKGHPVTQADFVGQYLLVFFGFTHCPDICPTTLSDISHVMDQLGPKATAVQPLFITLDPERDTPQIMAEYVGAFHPRIIGLTGTKAQIENVAKAYRVYFKKVSPTEYKTNQPSANDSPLNDQDYQISHQGNVYLMSPKGFYLTHFPYNTPPEVMADTIIKAIEKFGHSTQEGAP